MGPIRLGFIGVGAVAEVHHLPAAEACPEVRVTVLVDTNRERARAMAERFGVPLTAADYADVFDHVDAVIVASPNHLHAAVAVAFLERGIPVLVEKPLAATLEDARRIVAAAKANRVTLQVGHMLRFAHGACLLKSLIADGWAGRLRSFSLESGFASDWPAASGFSFDRAQAGGGVLLDLGSHMLDLLLWWLGDDVEVIEYRDDALGGVEAECELRVAFRYPTGSVEGTVVLSRLRNLNDMALIHGDRLTFAYDFSTHDAVRLWPRTGTSAGQSFVSDSAEGSRPALSLHARQLRAFAKAVAGRSAAAVPGESVLGTSALIERCYAARQPLALPWLRPVARPLEAGRS